MSVRDFSENSAVLSEDLATMLENDPAAFDVVFFKALITEKEDVTSGLGLVDEVGSIEGSDIKLDYADPVPAKAIMKTADFLSMFADEAAAYADFLTAENDVVLLLNQSSVPKQSVVQWTETADGGFTELSYMVAASKPFGKAPVAGYCYYCKPLLSAGEEEGF